MPPKNDTMSFSFDLTPGESVVNWDVLVNAFGLDPDDAVPFSEPNCSEKEEEWAIDNESLHHWVRDTGATPVFARHNIVLSPPAVKSVIFSGPATTILWSDNTKTTVKVSEGQEYDRYAGFCAAVVKKLYGSSTAAKKIMDKADVDLQRKARAAEKEALRKKQQEELYKARKKKAMSVVPSLEEFERLAYERAVDKVVDRLASDMACDLGDLITRKRTEAAIKSALTDKEGKE